MIIEKVKLTPSRRGRAVQVKTENKATLSRGNSVCKGPEKEGKTHRKNQRRPVCETGRNQEISEDEL